MIQDIQTTLKKEPIRLIESTHQYLYTLPNQNIEKFISVSKILSMLETPFDEVKMALKCSENPKHEFYNVSPAIIIQKWQEKNKLRKDIGHNAHVYNEGVLLQDESLIKQARQSKYYMPMYASGFDDFHSKVLQANNIALVGSEVIMCYPKLKIAGTTDYLGLWRDSLIVSDWKTNESFKDSSDYSLIKPFDFLDKSDLSKYTIQTYIYKYMLEEHYGLSIKDIRIIWFGSEKQFTCKHTSGQNWYSFAPKFKYEKSLISDIIHFGLSKC